MRSLDLQAEAGGWSRTEDELVRMRCSPGVRILRRSRLRNCLPKRQRVVIRLVPNVTNVSICMWVPFATLVSKWVSRFLRGHFECVR